MKRAELRKPRELFLQSIEETEQLLVEKRKLKAGPTPVAPPENVNNGDPVVGLIPKYYGCGHFARRINGEQLQLLKESIEKYYYCAKDTRRTIAESFRVYQFASDAAGVPAVSYTTYRKEVLKSTMKIARRGEQ